MATLDLVVLRQGFDVWPHLAYIVGLKVEITNTTDNAIRLSSIGIGSDWDRPPIWSAGRARLGPTLRPGWNSSFGYTRASSVTAGRCYFLSGEFGFGPGVGAGWLAGATWVQLRTVTGGTLGEDSRAARPTVSTRITTVAMVPSLTMS